MKRLCIITGATGGTGSELIKIISGSKEENLVCCGIVRDISKVSRDIRSNNVKYIEQDLVNADWSELNTWIFEQNQLIIIDEIVLLLAAGSISPINSICNIDSKDQKNNIIINVVGQVDLIRNVLNISKRISSKIRIIQLDSGAAYRPIEGWALYCSAKAYLSMYLQVLQEENSDAKVVLVDPGVIDTKMQSCIRNATKETCPSVDVFRKYYERGELRKPKDIANNIFEDYIEDWKANKIKEKLR